MNKLGSNKEFCFCSNPLSGKQITILTRFYNEERAIAVEFYYVLFKGINNSYLYPGFSLKNKTFLISSVII
jgi:hypothetical protein